MKKKTVLLVLWFSAIICIAQEKKEMLNLRLQRIDMETGQPWVVTEDIPCPKIGIIVMDMWDAHWCKSWTAREAAMIPKMNSVLALARKKGILVIFSPSSVAAFYDNYPQRQTVFAMPASHEYEYPSVDELLAPDEKKQLDYTAYSKRYFQGTIYGAIDSAGAIYKGFPPLPPFANSGGCECEQPRPF